jgi:hypothetical protein
MTNCVIPTTIVDDFYDDPINVRKSALKQTFNKDSKNTWPGTRSPELHIIDNLLFQHTINKFLSLYYDFNTTKVAWKATANFQLVDKSYDHGWIHTDEHSLVTGIIYLNDYNLPETGTTIYQAKSVGTRIVNSVEKEQYIKNPTNKDLLKYRDENNNQFEESVVIKNKFNRLVAFDSHLFHAANDFSILDDVERLTLVFFITKLEVNNYPIVKMRRFI